MQIIIVVLIFSFSISALAEESAPQDHAAQAQAAAPNTAASSTALIPGILIDQGGIDLSSGSLRIPDGLGAEAAEGPTAGTSADPPADSLSYGEAVP